MSVKLMRAMLMVFSFSLGASEGWSKETVELEDWVFVSLEGSDIHDQSEKIHKELPALGYVETQKPMVKNGRGYADAVKRTLLVGAQLTPKKE